MVELLKRYIKKYIPLIAGNVGFVLLQIIIQTVFLMAEMENIISNGVEQGDMGYVLNSGIHMLIYTLAIGACTIVASILSAKITAGLTCDIRNGCYKKALSLSPQDFDRFGESTLLTRTMTDTTQLQILMINLMRTSLMIPVIIICMLVLIFRINRVLFLILISAFVLTILLLVVLGARSKPFFQALQNKTDRINQLMKEKITGVRSIRAFGNEKLEEEKLSAVNKDAKETAIQANNKINFLSPLSMIIMNWAVVLIYLAGSEQLRAGMASVSDLILIFQYLSYFIASLAVVPVLVNLLPKVMVSSARINELLNYETGDSFKQGTKKNAVQNGEVVFDKVVFGYNHAINAIADVSFTAAAGKTTAFIGTTGSGKTTLMNLVMGFFRPNFGDIKIDGVSIRDMDLDDYRKNISYATQRSYVIQDTARNNITMYDDSMSSERITEACDAACFTEVIGLMPNGLDTVMSQGGKNISGGQRQRLSLARTVAKDAKIYIIDDSFSALDAETEKKARTNINKMLEGKTILLVSQKISTIKNADQIIVMAEGRIAGKGTHDELLKSCKEYCDIYETQCYINKEDADDEE